MLRHSYLERVRGAGLQIPLPSFSLIRTELVVFRIADGGAPNTASLFRRTSWRESEYRCALESATPRALIARSLATTSLSLYAGERAGFQNTKKAKESLAGHPSHHALPSEHSHTSFFRGYAFVLDANLVTGPCQSINHRHVQVLTTGGLFQRLDCYSCFLKLRFQ